MNEPSSPQDPTRLTRTVATLVLLPTVPMLLLSVAALGLFYLAPGRFGALLARLPGDEIIRTVLVFAPATLFAVVVLAALYALDRPTDEAPAADSTAVTGPRWNVARLATWGLLVPGLPVLVLAVGMWLFSFVAPTRFALLLEPLPGDAYLQQALRFAPLLVLAVVGPAALFLLLGGGQRAVGAGAGADPGRPVRWGVGLTLLASLPLLALSLAALGLFYLDPGRFDALLAQVTQESFIRLALVFTPAVLLSLALLAVLFLFFSRPARAHAEATSEVEDAADDLRQARQRLALWVLTGGLTGSAVVALGLLGVALLLILR
ncbi:MAG: hypothetical protein R3191_00435 [Anaerolineales bacterium]|nr:hypothetical protein [Anaerolineales bacterium]